MNLLELLEEIALDLAHEMARAVRLFVERF